MRMLSHRGSGFSLIEVLIALTIFAVGVLGIMGLQGIALMSSDYSGKMSIARLLATDQLERLGTLPFTASALDECGMAYCYQDAGGGVAGAQSNLDNLGLASGSGSFRREWNITDIDANVKQIEVRVLWTDVPGGASSALPHSFNRRLQVSNTKVNTD